MSKRIYELSKELAEELGIPIPNSELIDLIRKELPDLPVKQASSNVTGLYVEDIKEIARRAFAKPQSPPPPPPSTEDNSPQNSSIQKRTGKRIYELNKEIADKYGINVSNRDLIDCICKGFPDLVLKQSSSNIPAERIDGVVAYLRKKLGGKASPSTGETPPPPPAPRPSPAVKSGTPPVPPSPPATPLPPTVSGTARPPRPIGGKSPVPPLRTPKVPPQPVVRPPKSLSPSVPPSSATPKTPPAPPVNKPPVPPLRPPPSNVPPPLRPLPPSTVSPLPTATPAPLPIRPPAGKPPVPPLRPPSIKPAPLSTLPSSPTTDPAPLPKTPASPPPPKAPAPPPKTPVPPPRTPVLPPKVPIAPSGVVRPKTPVAPPVVPLFPQTPRGGKAPIAPPPPMVPPSGEIPPPAVVSPTTAQSPAESITTLIVRPPVIVREFAIALNLRPFRLISELMEMGIFASIGQSIEESIAVRIARKHGISLEIRHRGDNAQQPKTPEPKDYDNPAFLLPRPPVVCVLGHVDHGKTTLLDYYRKTSVVSGEAGGITQHVGAYSVKHKGADDKVQLITFLDTPGHAAFSKMRERGAEITDIAILVVAADDGFMPQTDEALKFAQKNNVQIVVAINKIDAKGANIDRIKQQMQQRNIASEDWGGTVLTSPISALKGDGMGELLDNILLQAEIMELKANPKRPAEGVIIEAQIETGRGPTAVLIVQKGTLKVGDAFVSGQHYCKVRALFDDHGNRLQSVSPGCPALTLGWSGAPTPGSVFQVCKNEREARVLAEENAFNLRKALEEESELERDRKTSSLIKLSDMDRLMAAIAQTKDKILKVVCKADVNGTLEALISCLEGIHSDKVRLEVIASSVGPVTPNDVNVAHAGGAIIVAFDVKQESGVTALLKRDGVRVISHNIIYMLIDIVKEEMAALLDPELRENKVGLAEVRAVFPHGKNGFVAGCMVTEGRIQRDYKARLHRKNQILYNGEIDTLKRFKDDATEVKAGYECGIRIGGFEDYQIGDSIECYEMLESRPTL